MDTNSQQLSTNPLPQPPQQRSKPLSKALLVLTLLAATVFTIAYASTYISLNAQLDKITQAKNGHPAPKVTLHPSITPATAGGLQQKQCTLEAKLCPDGSSVGRTGPNCEFAPCPTTRPSTSANTPTPTPATHVVSPTCQPRPACLSANPPCKIAITENMCQY